MIRWISNNNYKDLFEDVAINQVTELNQLLGKVIGYTVFFTMTAVEDLDEWEQKSVAVTGSAELSSLERNSQYAITVAARTKSGYGRLSEKVTVTVKPEDVPTDLRAPSVSTHSMTLSWQQPIRLNPISYQVTFDAVKEFVDSQGITQLQVSILSDPFRSLKILKNVIIDLKSFPIKFHR